MASKGQQVVEWAESQLGVRESPDGSNCGGCQQYQALYPGLGRCADGREGNWPWCGSFVGASWEAIAPGSKQYSHPSTAEMCASKPNVPAQPGAAFVICGTHTGILRYSLGGGSWACIDGNHGNQVAFSTRNLSGMQVVGPPWLGDGAAPEEPPEQRWYFLQDVGAARRGGQREYYGGWKSKGSRDDALEALRDDLGHELRAFKDPDFTGCFLIDNSAFVTEIYGGWTSEVARNDARDTLEERLGRTLRPYSEMRTREQGGVPWNCVNLEDPFA